MAQNVLRPSRGSRAHNATVAIAKRIVAPADGNPQTPGLTVYRKLRAAITDGQFHPNERLVEADLARMFETGRTAVQAALVRLEQDGLVERQHNRGARVHLVSNEEALEMQETRMALEQLLANRAATRLRTGDLAGLKALLTEMQNCVDAGDPFRYAEVDRQFHQRIWTIAGHRVARTILEKLKSQSIRFQFRTIYQPGRLSESLKEHRKLVGALATGDGEMAEAAMHDHLRNVVESLKLAMSKQS